MDSTTRKSFKLLMLALTGFCYFFITTAKAQNTSTSDTTKANYDSLLSNYLYFDSLLLDELTADSTSFLSILDNLMEKKYVKSTFSARIGYSGEITNAGRTIGINQYGFNAGVSYYHKSGLFADVSGYWNSDQLPNYSTTIIDIGYMGNFAPNWSYWATYDHYFYSKDADNAISYPFSDAINASSNYYLKKISFGIDYSFSFGDETAHRIRFNTTYNVSRKNWWIFDRVNLNPNASVLMGNASIVSWQVNSAREKKLIDRIGMMKYRYLQKNNPTKLNELLSYPVTSNAFGIMNYSLFIPVTFTIKKFSLMINYTLNLPVALPGEELDTSLNHYFSTTLIVTL